MMEVPAIWPGTYSYIAFITASSGPSASEGYKVPRVACWVLWTNDTAHLRWMDVPCETYVRPPKSGARRKKAEQMIGPVVVGRPPLFCGALGRSVSVVYS